MTAGVRHVVDGKHFKALVHQQFDGVAADEARASRNRDSAVLGFYCAGHLLVAGREAWRGISDDAGRPPPPTRRVRKRCLGSIPKASRSHSAKLRRLRYERRSASQGRGGCTRAWRLEISDSQRAERDAA